MAIEASREPVGGIGLFKVGGIQINLDFSWFIIFVLVLSSLSAGYFPQTYPGQPVSTYWIAGLAATLLFFFSILAHELCHSFVAMRSGIRIPEIILFIFGGMARLSEEATDPKTEFQIAAAGPLCSFALAGIFGGAQRLLHDYPVPFVPEILGYLAWVNVALAVFNLIPGFPLDGGRMFRAFWWWKTGSITQATKLASNMGQGFAVALMVLGGLQIFAGSLLGGIWLLFIGMFLRGTARMSYQELAVRRSLEGARVDDIMIKEVVTAPPELLLNRLISDYFLRYGYRGFPVTTNGKVLGLISLADLGDIPQEEHDQRTVSEVMIPAKPEFTIPPDTLLIDALKKMTEQDTARLLVMRDGQMLGMVTQTGLLRFLEIKDILERGARRPGPSHC